MFRCNSLGVVVANYSKELDKLKGQPRIYLAEKGYAAGIVEGIEHYNLFIEKSSRRSWNCCFLKKNQGYLRAFTLYASNIINVYFTRHTTLNTEEKIDKRIVESS